MKSTTKYATIIWIGLFISIGGLLYPNDSGAFSGPTLDPAGIEYIEIDAAVMIVNTERSYIVVAEKRFDVTEFKIEGEIYQSTLMDANGNDIPLKSFKQGQYVIVKGIKLSKDKYIADSIQIKASGSGGLKPMPKAPSIRPLK